MKSFADALKVKKVAPVEDKITNEYQSLVKKFLDRLNAARSGQIHPKTKKALKPLEAGFVASRMALVGINNKGALHWFFGFCNDASNFSSCWWYWTKTENVDKLTLTKNEEGVL